MGLRASVVVLSDGSGALRYHLTESSKVLSVCWGRWLVSVD